MTEQPPPREWLPEHLRGLDRDTVTAEQRSEIRAALKAHLAAMDAYWTPERRDARRERWEQRWAEVQAAEDADPRLRWKRLAEQAAVEAGTIERAIPQEGLAVFRETFDELVARDRASRAQDPSPRSRNR